MPVAGGIRRPTDGAHDTSRLPRRKAHGHIRDLGPLPRAVYPLAMSDPIRRLPATLLLCLLACSNPQPPLAGAPVAGTPAPAAPHATTTEPNSTTMHDPKAPAPATTAIATFGNGCFWCTEAVLERLDGVLDVVSGYTGGSVDHPTYEQVCSGQTGHAEVVQVTFDPGRISYATLCDWFFRSHDPTTLNRQGADVGTQYRSIIFTHDDDQSRTAADVIRTLTEQAVFPRPIVTRVEPLLRFWPAEDYHQGYFAGHATQPYCQAVISPKLAKLRQKFSGRLKKAT